jgi:hypothetical protein
MSTAAARYQLTFSAWQRAHSLIDQPALLHAPRPSLFNSRLACSIVAAACLGQSACVVRASIDVFEDPCPGISKTLYFAYW